MKRGLWVPMTADELEWVRHAASLRAVPAAEYVRQAINTRLSHEGVDAVLLRERGSGEARKRVRT